MILKGSQRSGAVQLAQHLMNGLENDHISVHDMRGFVSDDLAGAFKEIEAISKGTRCRQYLFSLSLNPPELENAPPEVFEAAIENIEKKLGLTNQPRAVIFHEKNGRRHAHCVWSRIDAAQMRSINLPHFKMKLQDIARDLYRTHEWDMPEGFKEKAARDPLNYKNVESEQAKRAKRDPKTVKAIFQRCWAQSDSRASFAHALAEQGYILAKGDRRGFVAVDRNREIYSVSRWAGIKTKEVRARLGVPDGLPHVDEALQHFEARASASSNDALKKSTDKQRDDLLAFTAKRLKLVSEQRKVRDTLERAQRAQIHKLRKSFEAAPSTGLIAIWQRVTGYEAKLHEEFKSQRDALQDTQKQETQQLIQDQLKQRRLLQQDYLQFQHHHELAVRSLWRKLGLAESEPDRRQDQVATLCVSDPTQPLIIAEEKDKSLAQRVRNHPQTILEIISRNKEEFTRNDIVRGLAKFIDNPTKLHLGIEQTLKSKDIVDISATAKKRYTTKELLDLKTQLQNHALKMSDTHHGNINIRYITAAINMQNQKLQRTAGARLSDEQEHAIKHVLGAEQLSLVTGYAGAGKSTMLEAASEAWRQSGYNVIGAALSGKAADGLESSSGIQSRTLASLEKSWEGGYSLLGKNDVLVIDEAGMVDLRQMARIVTEVKNRGAKLVLVGDAEQLQPIAAGTPFKNMAELVAPAKLSEIRRQTQDWQCKASKLLAEKKGDEALRHYHERGFIKSASTRERSIASLVKDYMEDVMQCGIEGSRIALAHRRKDVHLINQSIRSAYGETGLLGESTKVKTDHGPREFASGDRIVLTKNDRDLEVRNGMLGTVTGIDGDNLVITLDGKEGRSITLNPDSYSSIEHGYATTIHKSQGATVDRSFVLASKSMDRHLTYVAMTRHRYKSIFYFDKQSEPRFKTHAWRREVTKQRSPLLNRN